MNGPGVLRPARQDGQRRRGRRRRPVATTSWHGPPRTVFGKHRGELGDLRDRLELPEDALGRLGVEEELEPLVPLLPGRELEGLQHPPPRAEDVDRDRQDRALDVLEEQRRTARLHRAVRDLGDLESRRDPLADAHEVAVRARARRGRPRGCGRPRGSPSSRFDLRLADADFAIGASASIRPTSAPAALWITGSA